MKRFLLAMSALLMMSAPALAAPINWGTIIYTNSGPLNNNPPFLELLWETHDIGGGLVRFDVFLNDPNDNKLSYGLTALTFTGQINQNTAFGNKVDLSGPQVGGADFWANLDANYNKFTDSYFFIPFGPTGSGFVDSNANAGVQQRSYTMTGGTPGGEQYDHIKVAQIVAAGDVVITGRLARNGNNYDGGGTMIAAAIPEPSTFVLLGLGAVGMVAFARRRRK